MLSVAVPALADDIHWYSQDSNSALPEGVWRYSNTATQNWRFGGFVGVDFGFQTVQGETVPQSGLPSGGQGYGEIRFEHGAVYGYTRCRHFGDYDYGTQDIRCTYYHHHDK